MNVQVTPEVVTRLAQLTTDTVTLASLSSLMKQIAVAADRQTLLTELGSKIAALGDGLHVVRLGALRVFMTFGDDYALIVDVALAGGSQVLRTLTQNDPRRNSARNPRINASINPKLNSALNPRLNPSINPKLNSAINPRFNAAINPRFNSSINPRFNSAINPRFNAAVNPRLNPTINPRLNPTYPGPYIYGLNLDREGYLVGASDKVDLIFDNSGVHKGLAIHSQEGPRALFDNAIEWWGYLVPDGQGGYLRYDTEGAWNGIVV